MFDATKLLGTLLEHRSAPSAGDRLGNALNRGGLGGLLGALTGAAGGSGGRPGAAGVLDGLAQMARQAAAQPRQEVERNNPVAIGGLGALAGTLLGGGRGAVGGGLLAVLGSLAYAALQANQAGGAAGAGTAAPAAAAPGTPEEVHRSATLVLKAMIQAAKADGQLDAREIERITGKLHEAGEDREARDYVLREMSAPVDVEGLAREARGPKEAAEVYAASLMAIEVDTEAERDYLARLAGALGLAQPTVAYLHHSLGVPAP